MRRKETIKFLMAVALRDEIREIKLKDAGRGGNI
jgi:hypothetical protein